MIKLTDRRSSHQSNEMDRWSQEVLTNRNPPSNTVELSLGNQGKRLVNLFLQCVI